MADPIDGIHLEVVTRHGVAIRVLADEVQAPSVHGEFGVLPGHLPLLAALRSGVLTWRVKGQLSRAVIGPGFAEAGPDKVLVITEHFVVEEEIDPAATRRTLEEAREALTSLAEQGVESGARFNEFSARAEWCEAQLALTDVWPPGRRGGNKGGEPN
ncbi:MAG: ATP synthase F1 subunit epsilon [Deltaproteobacteria bacterium]|nr:ATP synthase F1 subunit epsilon [Deltaproteobacteria bacterium]